MPKVSPVIVQSAKSGWWRSYSGRFTINGPKIKGGGAFWAKPVMKLEIYPNIWVEYIPVAGPPIWAPSMVEFDCDTSTTAHNEAPKRAHGIIEPGSPLFVGDFKFFVEGDVDGKGYRVWSKDRTQLLGEENFSDIPDPLPIHLEVYRGDSFIVHADKTNPPIWGINARWSADGEHWSYTRGSVQCGQFGAPETHEESYEFWDRRIDREIFEKNLNPIIEVDIGIGLRRVIKRFEFGKNPNPIPGTFPAREPIGEDDDRARVERIINEKREKVMRRHRQEQLEKMNPAQRKIQEENDRRDAEGKEKLRLLKERIEKEKAEKVQVQPTENENMD